MNVLGDDIKIINGDIAFIPGNGDLDTAWGIDCLLQDIFEELQFPYLDDLDHPDRGNALGGIHVSFDQLQIEKLYIKQELYAILHRDSRIKKNSILVTLSDSSESITASVSFTTITNASIENLVVSNPGVLT